MRLTIKGRNIELTPALKQYATEKLSKITKLFDQIMEVTAILSVEKNPSITNNQVAEVSVTLKKGRIQAKEASESMYASIDLLADKVERQLRKHKTKLTNRTKSKSGSSTIRETALMEKEEVEETTDFEMDDDIVQIDLVQEEEN
ncbi:MAG: ribosome-associated translation inhibitor RaiA [Vampirovibrionia bacterium]